MVSALLERGRRTRGDRSRTRSRKDSYDVGRLVVAFALLIGLVTAGAMVVASDTHEHGIISAEFDSDRPTVIPTGETERLEFTLNNDGVLPMVAVLESTSEGVEVESREHYIERGGNAETTLSLTAPSETRYYLRTVSEYRYFAVLPPSIILTLHAIHPWLAYGAVTAVITIAFTLPFALLLGTNGRIRVRERTRKANSRVL